MAGAPHDEVSKAEAVRRLRQAHLNNDADELEAWRNADGNDQGWDGWFRGNRPDPVDIIWPPGP